MSGSGPSTVAHFYDELATDYHLVYADWDEAMSRQGTALDALIRAELGTGPVPVLDCSCGIGTQAIPLALRGHRVVGTDISPSAVDRAAREASARGVRLPTATADMRRLPFADSRFDAVVCADNSLPHLLTEEDVCAALAEMRRVLSPDGLLLISTRPYDEILRSRPASTMPRTGSSPAGRAVTFQLWDWHDDGEHYDLEHFRLLPEGDGWSVRVRRSTYWALAQRQLADFADRAGFVAPTWHTPASSGFFQPVLTARRP
ncbi:class I SAM-dependent methyltransferase [Streptomyces sp. NPDC056061]|uniref:class I SAM-dependent methyltransferase n=1 Tax=Streptomyces sp. NPDC056061 TaxID=3345700 RepID=UPI0035D552EF